jgi:hypothetical protein
LGAVVFALLALLLARGLPGPWQAAPRATPLPLVTATPVPPDRVAVQTPAAQTDIPAPGFATPDWGEQGEGLVTIPGLDWYAIQLGAYGEEQAAREQARRYTGRGAAGYVLQDGAYRVLAAAYATPEDAETIRGRLHDAQGMDTYVYHLSADTVELSVTAAQGQVQALRGGFDVLTQTLRQMHRLSTDLDAQRMDGATVVLAAQAMRLEVEDRQRALSEALGSSTSQVVTGLGVLLETARKGLETICAQNTQETVTLTSNIKYQQIDLLCSLLRYMRQLTAQQARRGVPIQGMGAWG